MGRLSIRACILPALLLFPVPSSAEETEELPEIIVEAERTSVIPRHFAGSAAVIEPEAIARSGARSVAELLASQGGVRFTSTSGDMAGGAVHMRGFGENSSSRVLILVDGKPVNRPDMASVSWFEIPLARLERVEILRGSQTARFGDNAVGGVINLITKSGGEGSTVVEGAGGSDGYLLARLSHRDSIAGNGIAFDLEHNFSDGWRQNAWSELDSAAFRWDRDLAKGSSAEFGVSWAEESGGFPGPLSKNRYLLNPRDSIYALAGQADQYFSEQTRWGAEAALRLERAGPFSLFLPLNFLRRDLAWNFGPGFHSDNLLDALNLAPTLAMEGDTWSAEAGIQYRRDTLDLEQFAEIERIHRTTEASLERDIFGLFASTAWEPSKGWHFTASARWEHSAVQASALSHVFPRDPALNFSRDNEEDNTGYQVGLRWEPSADLAFWLRYDRLYRLPSTDEIASYQGFPLSIPFNDRLRAETGHNVELGGEWSPGEWTFGLNGFLQRMEGEIAYDYLQNLNENLADTRRIGLESSLRYRRGIWEAALHHTALDATFESGAYSGKEVYLVPNREIAATLSCRPRDWLFLQAEYQYTGDSFEGNDFENRREKLPSYAVANLLVRYEPKPGLSIYCRVNNLFDEHYATVKYSGIWYPAAGRQVLLGIRHEL